MKRFAILFVLTALWSIGLACSNRRDVPYRGPGPEHNYSRRTAKNGVLILTGKVRTVEERQ
jgi:hypothetical protein